MSTFRLLLQRCPATVAVTVLLVAAFLVQVALGGAPDAAMRLGALRADRVLGHGELWRLWTVGLLHGGWIHLLLNGFALVQVAALVEIVHGTPRIAIAWVVGTLGASIGSLIGSPGYLPSVGASGPIFALVGILLGTAGWGFSPWREDLRERVAGRLVFGAALTFAIGFGLAWVVPLVDNAGHVGGLGAGLGLSWVWRRAPRPTAALRAGAWVAWTSLAAAAAAAALAGGPSQRDYAIDTARLVRDAAWSADGAFDTARLLQMLASHYEDAGAAYDAEAVAAVGALASTWVSADTAIYAHAVLAEAHPALARPAAERWLVLSPDDPSARNAVAWGLVSPTPIDPVRAELLAREALTHARIDASTRAAIVDTLAVALWLQGRRIEALAYQAHAVRLVEGDTSAPADDVRARYTAWTAEVSGT